MKESSSVHIDPLLIEQYLSGLVDQQEKQLLEEHTAQCPDCLSRLENTREELDRYLELHPPQVVAQRILEAKNKNAIKRMRFVWSGAGLAFASAAALFLVWINLPVTPMEKEPEWQTKGPGATTELNSKDLAVLSLYRGGSGIPEPFVSGSLLDPGDVVKIRVNPPTGKPEVVVVGMAHDGSVARLMSLRTEKQTYMTNSLKLEDSPGPERLFVLFSSQPISQAKIQSAATACLTKVQGSVEKCTTLSFAQDVLVRSFLVRKRQAT